MGKYKNFLVETWNIHIILLHILVKTFFYKYFVAYEALRFIYTADTNSWNWTLASATTYTLLQFPLDAEEGVGYAADFPVDVWVLSLAVLEDFVHVEVEEVMDDAASIWRLK